MATVPDKYDVIINSQGYMFADVQEVKASFGYTPPFVSRSNTQGDYGDNQQDFFVNFSQSDWSLGEGQKFFRRTDDQKRRYWQGVSADVSVPGQVSLGRTHHTVTSTVRQAACLGNGGGSTDNYFAASSTTLYLHSLLGESSLGAHGLTNGPSRWGMIADGDNLYMGNDTINTIRKYDVGATTFSTFSANAAGSLAFLNNTLFGYNSGASSLYYFDGAGTLNTVFTWKDADGNASGTSFANARLLPYGGKLLVLRIGGPSPLLGELYIADTTGVTLVAQMPAGFYPSDMCIAYGSAFICGSFLALNGQSRPGVLIYTNGSLDTLWAAPYTGATVDTICPYGSGVVFAEWSRGVLYLYDINSGSVSALTSGIVSSSAKKLTGGLTTVHYLDATNGEFIYPSSTTLASTAYVTCSLDDFDSSLAKVFRGIKVEFVAGSGGDLGSVDIAYRVGDVDGSYTTLQTGAVSGTEYALSGVTGRAISAKVTINKGTSTTPPVLKRVAVRAIAQQNVFRRQNYVLNLTGRDGVMPQQLRDGTTEPKDGLELATALRTAATGNPVSITDEFGTYTGVIETDGFSINRIRPNEFVASVPTREV